MRRNVQNYQNLADGLINDGFLTEAERVLLSFPYENPMINYYLGFFQDKKGDKEEAGKYFAKASQMPTDYVFLFSAEDEKVLLKVIEYRPKDAIPHYYLGNLLFDKQPQRALEYWEKSVQLDPSLAIAWRNLGWGYNYFTNDVQKSITAYEKAISLKKDEPVYFAELDVLYERNNSPLEKRAKLFESANEIVKKRDDAFVREILVLNLTGQADKSVQYLENSNFHFREGSSRISDMTVDARLLSGRKFMKEEQFQKALEQYLAAKNREAEDEQAGSRDPQINYFIATGYDALGNKKMAKKYFEKSTSQKINDHGFINYYQGLSFQKLGQNDKADSIFKTLIEEGTNRMNKESEIDFFAKFGEKESSNNRLSNANLLIGLGLKGLGKNIEAQEKLQKAVELSVSNLWAGFELNN
jgi:tetratricopeptide (TPR) repeat protein